MSRKDTPADEPREGEAFLQRWSRLKSTAQREGRSPAGDDGGAAPPGAAPAVSRHPEADGSPGRALPDLDSLDQDADYSAFLAADVEPELRRRALRKLFHSPKFNVCDGLDDYCDDFTRFAPLGGILTADMRHQLDRVAREALDQIDGTTPRAGSGTAVGGGSSPPAAPTDSNEPPEAPGPDDHPRTA